MACFHTNTEQNGEEKDDVQGKGVLKIHKSYRMGSNSSNCCYISLDGGDKLSESLKAMEQCMEAQ